MCNFVLEYNVAGRKEAFNKLCHLKWVFVFIQLCFFSVQLNDVGKRREYPYNYSYLSSFGASDGDPFFSVCIFSLSDRNQIVIKIFCCCFVTNYSSEICSVLPIDQVNQMLMRPVVVFW